MRSNTMEKKATEQGSSNRRQGRNSPGDPQKQSRASGTHLLGDLDGVDKVHVEAITQLDDSGRDLIKGDTLLAS